MPETSHNIASGPANNLHNPPIDVEKGRRPRPRRRSSASTSSSTDLHEEEEKASLDGHRPTNRELHDSISRSRSRGRSQHGRAATTSGMDQLRPTLSRRDTVLSRIRTRPNMAPFSHPLAHQPTTADVLVDFEGDDDPYRPMNWPTKKKVTTTLMYGLTTMSATWASSAYSAGTTQVAHEFHVGQQVAVLGTTLFLFGFGLGPLLWAPLSEVYGRRVAVLTPMFVAMCFSFGSAAAKDFQTLMITRFFGAFFASAPVTNTGGVLGDLFSPAWRAMAMAGYALAVVGGPCLGPIVSAAFVANPSLGWRWTEYFTGILQAVILLIDIVFIDECYPPKLLVYKARRLRHETGNWALHTKFEEWDVSIKELSKKFLIRPIQLLFTPICFLIALYASFCYGILYMQLGGIPIIFHEQRGWPVVSSTLPFLAILVGAVFGCAINAYNQLLYNKVYYRAGNRAVPEARLPPMMLGSVLFSAGQFVTGWTADPRFHWIAPVIGLVMLGTGFFTIFQAALNYLVDTFTLYAASAVAANTFLRSCFAGAFPLVVGPLYHNIGVGPASSITGGFAALLIPVPFVFYVFGKRVRRASKWSRGSVFD
ncbi:MSF membrane transporter [Cucurbitaria berberidis CBS 394.84]|uniref:MSF membrane transporter n=1 Tax=Cucurbitaria berberidis CBS 394.84 TaxID=1168544 RepID=A0A9P4GMC4_9PLEO|nr:MSF membrane transporter [Cucurbitaria berberidis CBS 394.84]KAF1847675.1 MSF membrane transporter [Cucurbitaria berberidis CBS 394.84]